MLQVPPLRKSEQQRLPGKPQPTHVPLTQTTFLLESHILPQQGAPTDMPHGGGLTQRPPLQTRLPVQFLPAQQD